MGFFYCEQWGVPNYDKFQQLRCSICFPHVVPPLIKMKTKGKKGIIAYKKSCGTNSMKYHIEALHFKLLPTYVAEHFVHDNVTGSQERCDDSGRLMQVLKKCTKVVTWAISSFFGNKTPYKRHNETQKLLLEDLMLLTSKGYFFLSTCENVWMCRLALKLDSKLMFPPQRAIACTTKKNKYFQLVSMT